MFNFSSKTKVNKEFKLSDFLRQIKASKEVREDAKKIKSIRFSNVINENTLNCKKDDTCRIIYVIELELFSYDIPKLFIKELDKNIAFHTYFVFKYDNKEASCIAFKQIDKKIIVDRYFGHDFHESELVDVDLFNSVEDVYKFLLSYEIDIKYMNDESLREYMDRVNKINRLRFEISKLEKSIERETQPKKKFLYNDRLRNCKKELKGQIKE